MHKQLVDFCFMHFFNLDTILICILNKRYLYVLAISVLNWLELKVYILHNFRNLGHVVEANNIS